MTGTRCLSALVVVGVLVVAGLMVRHGEMLVSGQGIVQSPCVVTPDKTASPVLIPLGEKTQVALTARPDCPQREVPVDVVLVIDNSGSMGGQGTNPGATQTKLDAAKEAATRFLERTDLTDTRVAIISFDTDTQLWSDLTQDRAALLSAIDGIEASGGTNIVRALEHTRRVVERGRAPRFWPADEDPVEVAVLLSDGRHNAQNEDEGRRLVTEAATSLKDTGAVLSTVCLGDDCDRFLMQHIASQRALYFVSPTAGELVDIYTHIAERLRHPVVSLVRVLDTIPDNMRFLPQTSEPLPDEIRDGEVTWDLTDVPPEGVTITYWVEPLEVGTWPTNVQASAEFQDTFGRPGAVMFPVPRVTVFGNLFLPLAVRDTCKPTQRETDVVLLIDVSSSMNEPARTGDVSKREAARRAARAFAQETRAGDRVAVLAFDDRVHTLTVLTSDRDAMQRAIDRLPSGEGTRIDAALSEAHAVLRSTERPPGTTTAIVLLTDGRPTRSGEAAVRDAASAARADGVAVFAIGLGADVNVALLRDVAGASSRYHAASDAATLEAIYRELASVVTCPGVWP